MRILITGKNSYIGNSFFEWVKENDPSFEIEQISLRNVNLKDFTFKNYDVILHVSGVAHITSNKKLIPEYFRVNRDLAIEVAKKAKRKMLNNLFLQAPWRFMVMTYQLEL